MKTGTEDRPLWAARDMSGTYRELDHPADLFLEIRGGELEELFENALHAVYRQLVDLDAVRPDREMVLEVAATSVEEALRALLAEALFRFDTEGFLAAGAQVQVERLPALAACGTVSAVAEMTAQEITDETAHEELTFWVRAHLWGEAADRKRHSLLAEIKAVTYHRLTATKIPANGWMATVLLDT